MDMGVAVSANAQQVINKRYSLKNEKGEPLEKWEDVVERVVTHVGKAETDPYEQAAFYNNARGILLDRLFIPNTPCLVNAGKPNAQLAGCFVLPVEDSIEGIMRTASQTAKIHQSGGGTGFTFENLRPAGSIVKTTHGVASGPVSFMEIFDKVTDVVKQGGVRRGANMGIMRCDHPDILRFIHAKNNQDKLTNFNISVAVTDEFMQAVKDGAWIQSRFAGKDWTEPVFDPQADLQVMKAWDSEEKRLRGMIYAPMVWERIIEAAHKWAEPGVIFIDTVNAHNLLMKSMGPITATNPCAEQALHNNNSCNLGSIDVSKFWNTAGGYFEWDTFGKVIYWSVRFLDNVVDTCDWPLREIDEVVKRTRPVGLGIMGFADLMLKMGIRYGSDASLSALSALMEYFQTKAWEASCHIGREKGTFPEFEANKEAYDEFLDNVIGKHDLNVAHTPRNYEVTTIAPTGTISLVAETSSGIEPNFAWSYRRVDTVSTRDYVHPLAEKALVAKFGDNFTSRHKLSAMQYFDQDMPDYFVTAHDLTAEEHVRVLATAQQFVDNGVSKTCNGHENDTVEDVRKLYELAYSLGVKSVSYYRDGSRTGQVLTAKSKETKALSKTTSKLCPDCKVELQAMDGCETCVNCGLGKCSIA